MGRNYYTRNTLKYRKKKHRKKSKKIRNKIGSKDKLKAQNRINQENVARDLGVSRENEETVYLHI